MCSIVGNTQEHVKTPLAQVAVRGSFLFRMKAQEVAWCVGLGACL